MNDRNEILYNFDGKFLRDFRKRKGLTQKQLGELCGMNEVQIRRYELNKVKPKIKNLEKIADALEIDVIELLPYEDWRDTSKIEKVVSSKSFQEREEKNTQLLIDQHNLRHIVNVLGSMGYEISFDDYFKVTILQKPGVSIDDFFPNIDTQEIIDLEKEFDELFKLKLEKLIEKYNQKWLDNPDRLKSWDDVVKETQERIEQHMKDKNNSNNSTN